MEVPEMIVDEAKKAQNKGKQAEVRRKLDKELKIPGRFKSSEEVTARMLQLFKDAGGIVPLNPLLPALNSSPADVVPSAADEGVKKTLQILNK
jgi:hypothetical protein